MQIIDYGECRYQCPHCGDSKWGPPEHATSNRWGEYCWECGKDFYVDAVIVCTTRKDEEANDGC